MRRLNGLFASWPALAAFYALLSVAVLLVFSQSTSPLWLSTAFDQSIFSVIGRNWAEGQLPYTTAWDSKGPIIFFFNMLGHRLSDGETGTFVLQAVNLTAVLCLCHGLLRRYLSSWRSLLASVLFLLAYVIDCSGGNQVGDYTLLLSVGSVFCTYRWTLGLEQGRYRHPWRYAFVYGLFFSACLLSRLTNAMVLSMSVLAVLVVLVGHGLWRNLLANALGFVAGFLVIFVPFAAYFWAHSALGEMWYATFTYNLEYALHSSPINSQDSRFMVVYYLFYFICLVSTLLSAVLNFLDGRRRSAAVWFVVSAVTLLWLARSYANANYAISYLPLLLVALLQMSGRAGRRYQLARYMVFGVVLAGFANYVRVFSQYANAGREETADELAMILSVPQTDSFVAYNCQPALYLQAGRRPHCRFFVCQDWAIANGPTLRERVRASFVECRAQWILFAEAPEPCAISDLLKRDYEPTKKDEAAGLILYKRRD